MDGGCLYLKDLENFMGLILLEKFWLVHIYISCTIPSESPFLPSLAVFCIPL